MTHPIAGSEVSPRCLNCDLDLPRDEPEIKHITSTGSKNLKNINNLQSGNDRFNQWEYGLFMDGKNTNKQPNLIVQLLPIITPLMLDQFTYSFHGQQYGIIHFFLSPTKRGVFAL